MPSMSVAALLLIIVFLWLFLGFLAWRQQRYVGFGAWLTASFWMAVISLWCGESIWCLALRLCS